MLLCLLRSPLLNTHIHTQKKDVTAQQELQQAVLREAGKYGEMVQAVYDTLLTKDVYSQYFGNCVPGVIVEGQKLSEAEPYTQLGDEAKKYKVRCVCVVSLSVCAPSLPPSPLLAPHVGPENA